MFKKYRPLGRGKGAGLKGKGEGTDANNGGKALR